MPLGLEFYLNILHRFATGIDAPCALEVVDSSLALLNLRDKYVGASADSASLGRWLQDLRREVLAYDHPIFFERGARDRLLASLSDSEILPKPFQGEDDYRDDLMRIRFEADLAKLVSRESMSAVLAAAAGLLMIHRERLHNFGQFASVVSARNFFHGFQRAHSEARASLFDELLDHLERLWLWRQPTPNAATHWKTLEKVRVLSSSLALLHWSRAERLRKPGGFPLPPLRGALIGAYEDLMKASYFQFSESEWRRTANILGNCRNDMEEDPLSPESLNADLILFSWFERFDLTPRADEDFEAYWTRLEESFLRGDLPLTDI